jgi:hypothetical protein
VCQPRCVWWSCRQISDVDRSSFVDDLQAVLNANPTKPADDKLPVGYVPTREDASTTQFFKVKWTQAMDLVSSRRVFLRGGFAFVPRDKLVSIIVNRYKSHVRALFPPRQARNDAVFVVIVDLDVLSCSSCRTRWLWPSKLCPVF